MTPTQPNALEAPHQLQLDSRARLHMTGVIEVESLDESTIVLTTTRGTLIVRGEGLHLQLLRLDGGEVLEDGSPSEVIDNPKNDRTREFMSKML